MTVLSDHEGLDLPVLAEEFFLFQQSRVQELLWHSLDTNHVFLDYSEVV